MQITDWLEKEEKRILVTNQVANGNALVRKYNFVYKRPVAEVSVITPQQIAREVIVSYAAFSGEMESGAVIDRHIAVMILHEIINNTTLRFLPDECKCIETSQEIWNILYLIRANEKTDKYVAENGNKLEELDNLIKCYEDELIRQGLLDEISLIKDALSVLENIDTREKLFYFVPGLQDCEMSTLEKEQFSAIELALIDKISDIGKIKVNYDVEYIGKENNIEYNFFRAYGQVNEIEYVARRMISEKLECGNVNLFYTTSEYENLIKGVLDKYSIPYVFPNENRASSLNIVQLLLKIIDFAKNDFTYSRLQAIVENPVVNFEYKDDEGNPCTYNPVSMFCRVSRYNIGWGKDRYLSFVKRQQESIKDTEMAHFCDFLYNLVGIFDEKDDCDALFQKLLVFAKTYTYKKNTEIMKVSSAFETELNYLTKINNNISYADKLKAIENDLEKMTFRESISANTVSVYYFDEIQILERPYNFFVGLSQKQFVLKNNESPVLTDEELQTLLKGKVKLAKDTNSNREKNFKATINTLHSGHVIMGYSSFDTLEQKDSTPSILLLEYMKKSNVNESQMDRISYNRFVKPGMVDSATLLKQLDIDATGMEANEDEIHESKSMEMSSTGLQTLLNCPLQFYYQKIKKIPDVEFPDREGHQWLDAAGKGNLLHYTLDRYCKGVMEDKNVLPSEINDEVFNETYNQVIEKLLEEQPCPSTVIFERERDEGYNRIYDYVKQLHVEFSKWYANNNSRKIIGTEIRFSGIHYERTNEDKHLNIDFNGSIDRMDGFLDENGVLCLLIMDYKTGASEKLQKKIKELKQIQHYVYGMAALEYANSNKEYLSEIFESEIDKIKVLNACYVFPYEDGKRLDAPIEYRNSKVALPESVEAVLWDTIGCLQNNEDDKLDINIDEFLNDKAVCMDGICKYCGYTDICRMYFK